MIRATILLSFLAFAIGAGPTPPDRSRGVLPVDAAGKPLNLDFEAGTLQDWKARGEAFAGPPVEGDTVAARRGDMASRHAGTFWVGGFEAHGDAARGTLTSAPFQVTHPYASFLIGAGSRPTTRAEVVAQATGKVLFKASGDDTEDMRPAVVDLRAHRGERIFVRLVDDDSEGWGHVNFDDFRFHDEPPAVAPRTLPDLVEHDGLAPEEAARAMTLPPGFSARLFAGEPDVMQPIAFAFDDQGRLWVAEAYSYPLHVPEDQARDRILIFEDADGDGHFDTRKVFADKLNLVSGLEVGFGGVYVGAAPNLLFIPDKDHDDTPDGPPVVLLDGWAFQDTHETLNSFAWGPDGWLYGCHGVFTHSRVGKPGTPDADRTPINAGIWRYHPTKHAFEVFAHGTSNPWGVDFDDHGQAFETACVIPHLYHMIQGGRFERQAGPHFNPSTYDDLKTIADHRHYVGGNPHAANGRSDGSGGGHAHAGAMIYLGGAWPEEFRGSLFMNNIHGARLNRDTLAPEGSGFVGHHAPDFLLTHDRWSQIINLKYGPDGQVTLIDWYDKNQCHHFDVKGHDRTNGRIFKIVHEDARPTPVDLRACSDAELVAMQRHPNEWQVRHSRRVLQERGPNPEVQAALAELASTHPDEPRRLRALWALHAVGGLDESRISRFLRDSGPYVRAWTVQLALQDADSPDLPLIRRLTELAASDPSVVVRLYLASAAQRIAVNRRFDLLSALVQHGEDAADHNLPLMIWYASEPLAEADTGAALRLAERSEIPLVRAYLARRVASLGTPEALTALIGQVRRERRPAARRDMLREAVEALKGRKQVPMPPSWPDADAELSNSPDEPTRELATALGLTFGDPSAMARLRARLVDPKAGAAPRRDALAALLKAHAPDLSGTLHGLLSEPELRAPAIRGLAALDDPRTPEILLNVYQSLPAPERRDALNTLAARVGSARALLSAVGAQRLPAADLSADLVRQLHNLKDAAVDSRLAEVWGTVRETGQDRAKLIARSKALLTSKPQVKPDPMLGRAVFARTCAQCHTLFDEGGKVGPELTGSNRADLDYLLSNVLDPDALIGKDYLAHVVATTDGRVLTGIIRAEDQDSVTLVTANETLVLPRSEIEDRKASDKSMMPDDLWSKLSEHEVRSLVTYLASPAQVPLPPSDEKNPEARP